MKDANYIVYFDGMFNRICLKELAEIAHLPKETRLSKYSNDGPYQNIWSARLSTGLFGLTSCEAGNRGPKEPSELILLIGNEGLDKIVKLGFITCPSCHPEKIGGFWEVVRDTVNIKYNIKDLGSFIDKRILPFDARRVEWEIVLPMVSQTPNRIYVPKGLSDSEITAFNNRFLENGFNLPPIGYYNPEAPGRFSEYSIPVSKTPREAKEQRTCE